MLISRITTCTSDGRNDRAISNHRQHGVIDSATHFDKSPDLRRFLWQFPLIFWGREFERRDHNEIIGKCKPESLHSLVDVHSNPRLPEKM